MIGKRLTILSTILIALTLSIATRANATTYSWTGAASNVWPNQNNWNPIGVPSNGDSVVFPLAASNLTNINDLAPGTSLVAVAFNGGGYTINGNGIVLTISLTSSSGNNVLNVPIDVQTNAVTITSGNLLTIGGNLSGTEPITLNGNGVTTFTGAHAYAGTITTSFSYIRLNGASLPNATVTNGSYYLFGNGTLGAVTNNY